MKTIYEMLEKHPGREARYIAEIGLNHNGDMEMAARMITAAAAAGADAVKFQTIVPEGLVSSFGKALMEEDREAYRDFETIEFFRQFFFDEEQHRRLAEVAGGEGIYFLSSPFAEESVTLLEETGVPLYKLASSEVTNIPLVEKVAATGKPCILSTGMAREEEIRAALDCFKGRGEVLLLHCVSNYPLEPQNANLNRISRLRSCFGGEVGFSDHSRGSELMRLASMLGARVFEKHFTIDSSYDCPDKEVSVTPEGFSSLIEEVEEAIAMAGNGEIDFGDAEAEIARGARRSLFARKSIPAGKIIKKEDLIALRPGTGISPDKIHDVAGRKAAREIEKDMLIRDEYLQRGENGE